MKFASIRVKNRYVVLFLYFFILALIIISITILPLYFFATDILKHEQYSSNEFLLQQIKSSVDSTLKQVDRIASRIIINSTLTNISFKSYFNLYDNLEQYTNDVDRLRQIVRNEKINYSYIHSIYLYLPRSDLLLADGILFHLEDFNDKTFVKDILNNSQSNGWVGPRQIIRKTASMPGIHPGKVITLYRKSNFSGIKDASIMVAINIDIKIFNDVISGTGKHKDLQFYLANPDGDILASYNGMIQDNLIRSGISLQNFNDNIKYWEQPLNNEDMMISCLMSEYNNWRYLVLIPKDSVMKPLLAVKRTALFIFLSCFLAGLTMAYIFSNKYYRPINKLVHKVICYSGHNNSDDFDLLNSVFHSLIEENINSRGIIESNWNIIKDKYVLDILNGNNPSTNSISKIDFKFKLFRVLCLERDDMYKFSEFDKSLALYNIEHICIDICSMYSSDCIMLTAKANDSILAIILNYNESTTDRAILDLAENIKAGIKQQLGISCTIGIGKAYSDQQNIKLSYKEALNALECKIFVGPDSIINFSDVSFNWSQYDETDIIVKKALLLESIKARNEDRVYTIIEEIGSMLSHIPPQYFNRIKFLTVTICQDIAKLIYNTGEDNKEFLNELFEVYNIIDRAQCISDLIMVLKRESTTVVNYLNERTKQINDKMLGNILSYIQRHYNEDYSIETLAEKTKLHPAYLGKLIKEATGQTFPQYVTALRVERAKKLLVDTNRSIKEIYEELGYTNRQSFLRAFKSETGFTPTEYRKLKTQTELGAK